MPTHEPLPKSVLARLQRITVPLTAAGAAALFEGAVTEDVLLQAETGMPVPKAACLAIVERLVRLEAKAGAA